MEFFLLITYVISFVGMGHWVCLLLLQKELHEMEENG
jgi:hypothetical protein